MKNIYLKTVFRSKFSSKSTSFPMSANKKKYIINSILEDKLFIFFFYQNLNLVKSKNISAVGQML